MTVDANAWRGVAAEKAEEVSAGLAALLRERSRRLLGDLLRPHRRAVIATISLIVVESLAALAGPWLVGLAIDNGLPPLVNSHDAGPLLGIAAAFAVAVAVQAVTTRMFVTMTGRVGQSWAPAGAPSPAISPAARNKRMARIRCSTLSTSAGRTAARCRRA